MQHRLQGRLRMTLFIVCAGKLLGPVLLECSPVRRLRDSDVKGESM